MQVKSDSDIEDDSEKEQIEVVFNSEHQSIENRQLVVSDRIENLWSDHPKAA